MSRTGRAERITKETRVVVELNLDGEGRCDISSGVPFFDHMLAQLGKHGGMDLAVRASGDTEVDAHHTVEDTAIVLGEALRAALVDRSGRPYVAHDEPAGMAPLIGSYDTTLTRHIFESFAFSAAMCLHVRVLAGRNPHHIVEAQFKAVARAVRDAAADDPRASGVPSTKGVL